MKKEAELLLQKEKVNILVVDDRPDGLLAIEAVLNLPEYNLIKASSGQEALSQLFYQEFSVILLDVQMPVMNGFETAKIIKQNEEWKDIPIIFLTAINKEISHVYQGYECGAVDYLFKPFDPWILKSKVAVSADLFLKNKKVIEQAKLLQESEQREHERRLVELEIENLRRYKNLANAIPHIVWKGKRDGNLEYFNEVWFNYTGLSQEQSNAKSWQSVIYPEDRERFFQAWNDAITNASPLETECRLTRRDEMPRWHLLRTTFEYSKKGEVTGLLGTCTDIHDRKVAEEELQKIREDLEIRVQKRTADLQLEIAERIKAQKEVLEIRDQEQKRIGQDLYDGLAQQLAGISFMSKVLEQKLTSRGSPEAQQAQVILELVKKTIHETKRLARGFYPIELERHGLFPAMEELALNTEKQFHVLCECDFDHSIQISDHELSTHLYRIGQEAVHNAIKHGGAKKITLSFQRNNGPIIFSVQDDGVGIHKDPDGMGMRTMSYRAKMMGAFLSVERLKNGGTLVHCVFENDIVSACDRSAS